MVLNIPRSRTRSLQRVSPKDDKSLRKNRSGSNRSLSSGSSELLNLTVAQQIHLLVEEPESSRLAKLWSQFIIYSIAISITSFVLSSVNELQDTILWFLVDICSFVIFTFEYVVRLLVCNAFGDVTRCQFLRAPGNVVDLMSIVPVFLFEDVQAVKPFKVFRAVRLVRIFRVFKLSKYSTGMNIMAESVMGSARSLAILALLLGIGVMFFSSLIYHTESQWCPATPDMTDAEYIQYREECTELATGWSRDGSLCCDRRAAPDDFRSIATAFWWSMVTMTTVGYGDKVPRTLAGRVVGCLAMVAGIVLISLPVAVVGSKFQEAYEELEIDHYLQQQHQQHQRRIEKSNSLGPFGDTCGPLSPVGSVRSSLENDDDDYEASAATCKSSNGDGDGDENENENEDDSPLPQRLPTTSQSPHAEGSQAQQLEGADVNDLREKLRILEGRRKMPLAARRQVELLLEMFEHLDRVDKRLRTLREKDAELDGCIRQDFAALARAYHGFSPTQNQTE